MRLTSRSQYIDIVQHHYFGGMARAQPEFLSALHVDYALAYSGFEHFVDVDAQRSACTFLLQITPRSSAAPVGLRKLRNCNFFQFEAGLITTVTAYFAIPPVDIDPWRR